MLADTDEPEVTEIDVFVLGIEDATQEQLDEWNTPPSELAGETSEPEASSEP